MCECVSLCLCEFVCVSVCTCTVVHLLTSLCSSLPLPLSLSQVPRQYPFDNLYLERGGDPNKSPSEGSLDTRIKTTYGNEYSS